MPAAPGKEDDPQTRAEGEKIAGALAFREPEKLWHERIFKTLDFFVVIIPGVTDNKIQSMRIWLQGETHIPVYFEREQIDIRKYSDRTFIGVDLFNAKYRGRIQQLLKKDGYDGYWRKPGHGVQSITCS
ncbi:hypothetical protein O9K51_05358 [Purpureocillium lavendulum]|uniref:Uncharacterized protein n=1 Tax=Purpureocillium lavendulum TaxID=1247861 RepID=A0AB34FR82_9HYPO|nr:hypothetical protein O9K51_05358 [Purpureocillium lavendulum]